MKFDINDLMIDGDVLVDYCNEIIQNIKKEKIKLLIVKLLLDEKKYYINDEICEEINSRLKNELEFNSDDSIRKLIEESDKLDFSKYLEIGKKLKVNDEYSITLYLGKNIFLYAKHLIDKNQDININNSIM